MNFDSLKIDQEKEQKTNIQPLYRGIWSDKLKNGDILPVGGSMFSEDSLSDDSTLKLVLDFDKFEKDLQQFNINTILELFNKNKIAVKDWLKDSNLTVDTFTFFLCYQVQNKVHKLLNVDNSKQISHARFQKYSKQKVVNLSELIGITECGEQAALGQYLLQRLGIKSAYVSGVTMNDINNEDEYPENHSFIVMKLPETNNTLIFDIARPKSNSTPENATPRLLVTDVPLSYNLIKNIKTESLVGASDVIGFKGKGNDSENIIRTRLFYGVGDNVAGKHKNLSDLYFK